jgi:hypothetical protein
MLLEPIPAKKAGDLLPYFDVLDEAYKSEARYRTAWQKRVSRQRLFESATVVPSEPLVDVLPPTPLQVASPFVVQLSGGERPAFQVRAAPDIPRQQSTPMKVVRVDPKKELEKRLRRERRAAELEELRKKDPFKWQKEVEKDEQRQLKKQQAIDEKKKEKKEKHKERQMERVKEKKEKKEKRERAQQIGEGEKKEKRMKTDEKPDIVKFKANMSEAVMAALKPYYASKKIADKDSCKQLCRKLTKQLIQKEAAKGNTGSWNPKMGPAASKFVEGFMQKLQARNQVYKYVEGASKLQGGADEGDDEPVVMEPATTASSSTLPPMF